MAMIAGPSMPAGTGTVASRRLAPGSVIGQLRSVHNAYADLDPCLNRFIHKNNLVQKLYFA
ncbi:hypothetical protein MKK75_26940 [Methylobacterium sp. J-030]|uniref:hypothetical protein n=1 Tax=Methylobacterium sp. J-030 TaxID=2836627 RepID=UPI001FB97FAD|nr:hypothetical protein [Methylobacterium sp. J-030]MCJ2072385.1 hypothetical protein [Methylobacterium sp. J-030]